MPRVINFEGRRITVPDDFTDDDISVALAGSAPQQPAPQQGPPDPAMGQVPTQEAVMAGSSNTPDFNQPSRVEDFARKQRYGAQQSAAGLVELGMMPADFINAGANLNLSALDALSQKLGGPGMS